MNDAIEAVRPHLENRERADVHGVWIRRAGMLLLLGVAITALCNVVGQRASTASVASAAATMIVHSPTRVRPGLLFQAKVTIIAHEPLPHPAISLGSGWIDGLTLNTEEPGASTETAGTDGSLVLHLQPIVVGKPFVQYLDYQVNPTSISSRTQTVTLLESGHPVLSLARYMIVIP